MAVPARRDPLALAATAFFASGLAALVYQVAWQRILALHTGVGIYSVAMIVAAFMAGLGVGSHVGGVLSSRLTAARALLAFGAVEVLIAVFGVVSVPLYYDLLYTRAPGLYAAPWAAGVLHRASLLPPTALMGMSLPFLSRALVADAATAGRTIGVLYGINMLGAGAGALLTPWVLVRHLGLAGAVLVAAALPGRDRLWLRLHGASSSLAMAAEDATSVVAILPWADGWHVVVNGKHHSRLPFGGVHTRLGAIPALVHPSPTDVPPPRTGAPDPHAARLPKGIGTTWLSVDERAEDSRKG